MVTTRQSRGRSGEEELDRLALAFDDERAVANAGLVLVGTLVERLGIEEVVDETLDLGERAGAARPGRKLLTLVCSALVGGDSIDDAGVLRCGETERVLGHRVMAPSTLGTFLRSFTFGHVRQLDRVFETIVGRAWAGGAGPGCEPLTIDLDSTIVEVSGEAKQGASFGYTKRRGYHPILATRADTGEVLHIRLRKGSANTSRGMLRFCDELIARVTRAGATGSKLLRADSGFWSKATFAKLDRAGWSFSIGVRLQPAVRAAIEQIDETAWQTLADYPPTSIAQIAETTLNGRRLVVRRVRTLDRQGELLPSASRSRPTAPS
nr:IS1380 family transposase [Actinomycetota bacterium]